MLDESDPRLVDALAERRRARQAQGVELLAIRRSGERSPVEVDSEILAGEPEHSFVIGLGERPRSRERSLKARLF